MVATSNGLLIERPRFFVDCERKLKLLQQRVFRKRKGSNNWLKAQATASRRLSSERVHSCDNCGYRTDRDVAAAQVVLTRGLAAVGHRVKMLSEGKYIGIPAN